MIIFSFYTNTQYYINQISSDKVKFSYIYLFIVGRQDLWTNVKLVLRGINNTNANSTTDKNNCIFLIVIRHGS